MLELREHQKRVLDKLRTGVILKGGVGSGKSMTALAYYYSDILGGSLEAPYTLPSKRVPLYIITTAKKRDELEWSGELARFGLSTSIDVSINSVPVVVDSWNNIQKYIGVKDAFFIFDEQRLVGSGPWVKAFLKIAANNQWIILTATPGDDWIEYAPVFIANGFYKNRTEFVVKHVVYSRFAKYPKVDHYVNVDLLIKNRNAIVINMAYSNNKKIENVVLTADYDKVLMDRVLKDRWNIYKDRPIRHAGERCYVERHVVNSDPSRLDLLAGVLEEHKKLIVFYNFNYELDMLRSFLTERGTRFAEWNGHNHQPVPTGSSWVYLVQYTAGAEAWNCITTNAMLFFSQHYSYKIRKQAEGRIDRMNTPFDTLYYFFIVSESLIDKSIERAYKEKRNFNEIEYDLTY